MENKIMTPEEKRLRELSERMLTQEPMDTVFVDVTVLADQNLFKDWIYEEFSALRDAIENEGGTFNLSLEDFTEYCQSRLQDRVAWVRNDPRNRLFHPVEAIVVPAFLSTLLANIGRVLDPALGIELVPQLNEYVKYDEAKMRAISSKLQSFSRQGYQFALGYAKDKKGTWELMAMQLVAGQVVRHDAVAHPVYATMAAVLGLTMTNVVLTPRIRYGGVDRIRGMLRQVVSFAN